MVIIIIVVIIFIVIIVVITIMIIIVDGKMIADTPAAAVILLSANPFFVFVFGSSNFFMIIIPATIPRSTKGCLLKTGKRSGVCLKKIRVCRGFFPIQAEIYPAQNGHKVETWKILIPVLINVILI